MCVSLSLSYACVCIYIYVCLCGRVGVWVCAGVHLYFFCEHMCVELLFWSCMFGKSNSVYLAAVSESCSWRRPSPFVAFKCVVAQVEVFNVIKKVAKGSS